MRHEEVGELLDYVAWMRDRVLAAAAGVTEVEFRTSDTASMRSLRATLAHQVENEWAWRVRLSEGSFPVGDVLPEDYPTVGALTTRFRHEERELRAWFDGLSDADLAVPPPGDDAPLALWRYLLYVVNHGTQQFTEAAVTLTRLGHSPGELGFLEFCTASVSRIGPAQPDVRS